MSETVVLPSEISEKSAFLKNIKEFSILDQEGRDTLAQLLQKQSCHAGYTFFHQGDVAPTMYFIIDGTVDVIKDGKSVVPLGVHNFFGEVGILHDTPRNATVKALTDMTFYVLEGFLLRELMKNEPVISLFFERVLSERG